VIVIRANSSDVTFEVQINASRMTHPLYREGPSTFLECVLDNTEVLLQSAVSTARYDMIVAELTKIKFVCRVYSFQANAVLVSFLQNCLFDSRKHIRNTCLRLKIIK